ncbi:hypothetical protein F4009_14890 [Candidatus Poribacteria bacterium]|nr:hypothetical protein [Candidatus Poribacteria bacterium]MYH83693.1 hypothetical protein [Candidatus Poribacteria bacterium]MYK95257.1 hypothetical protein [Candidatus Poribacteria bacterium]
MRGGGAETPEAEAYAQAQEKDWDEVGRSGIDENIATYYPENAHLIEGAAVVSSLYWGRGKWALEGDFLKNYFSNRYKWAEEWLNKKQW